MFGTTTVLSLLLTTATAFPISWPRIVTRDYTPTQLAQGTNFYFDSLHLETQCSPGQIACVDSNLAKCSPEGNWEITPCTGNTTCLAVPSSDNGLLVQCMLFTDAQAAIGDENVSVDQGVQQAPMNTATAVASPSVTPTATESASESASATESATPTESADPNATCTDGAEEPEATETQTITVILTPNPTESGVFITSTLTGDVSEPTETTEIPSPSDGEIATETGSDGVTVPAITPTESSPAAEPTCTETPEEPEETYTETDPTETEGSPEEDQPSETSSEQPTETTSTEEAAAPTEAAPSDAAPSASSSSSSEGVTLTLAPGFNPAPTPPANASAPEVIVGGTHFIPAPSASATPAPAKMMRVRRSS